MTWLPDSTVSRLREITDWPDLSGTKYEIIEKLGNGGMATVFLAQDCDLQRPVAVKVIHAHVVDAELQERMLMEARTIARLQHPGILPVHDLGFLPDGRIYYVMKFVRGRRLNDFAAETTSLPDRLRMFLRICDAVAFAHSQGVIHRDLKPSNVMVGDFGEVLVIDWGLAKVIKHDEAPGRDFANNVTARQQVAASPQTLHGVILGTPGYMAPEQEQGQPGLIDERTDVYGLGVLLGSLLPDSCPKSVRAISNKAKSGNAVDRYSTVAELAHDINCFLSGARVTAFPESPWETGRRLLSRHRAFVILIATYLVVRVVLLLFAR